MKRWVPGVLFVLFLVGSVCQAESSLIGPWFRYLYQDLGFQIPVTDGWRVTPVPQGLVFAMQYAPQPYVRVAVGRMSLNPKGLDSIIASLQQGSHSVRVQKDGYFVDGHKAVYVEGTDPEGPFRDVFIEKDGYLYWIGFSAERPDLWPQYTGTFDIILDGFRFI